MESDSFHILGLKQGAPTEEVRKAYIKLARQWHPDKNENTDTTAMFQKLNEAYCTILSTEKTSF